MVVRHHRDGRCTVDRGTQTFGGLTADAKIFAAGQPLQARLGPLSNLPCAAVPTPFRPTDAVASLDTWASNLVTHVSPTCICSQEEDFKGLAATLALLRQSPAESSETTSGTSTPTPVRRRRKPPRPTARTLF